MKVVYLELAAKLKYDDVSVKKKKVECIRKLMGHFGPLLKVQGHCSKIAYKGSFKVFLFRKRFILQKKRRKELRKFTAEQAF